MNVKQHFALPFGLKFLTYALSEFRTAKEGHPLFESKQFQQEGYTEIFGG